VAAKRTEHRYTCNKQQQTVHSTCNHRGVFSLLTVLSVFSSNCQCVDHDPQISIYISWNTVTFYNKCKWRCPFAQASTRDGRCQNIPRLEHETTSVGVSHTVRTFLSYLWKSQAGGCVHGRDLNLAVCASVVNSHSVTKLSAVHCGLCQSVLLDSWFGHLRSQFHCIC